MAFRLRCSAVGMAAVLSVACSNSPTAPSPVTLYGVCGLTPNYASTAMLQRWQSFPVSVSINIQTAVPPPWYERYRSAYRAGVELWAQRLGDGTGAVTVSFDNASASIQVTKFAEGGCDCITHTLGPRRPDRDPLIVRARIDHSRPVFEETEETPEFLTAQQTRAVAHDMGHALGILGHSTGSGDLMAGYPYAVATTMNRNDPSTFSNPLAWITESDAHTMWQAYCQ